MECEYCKRTFCNKGTLKTHQSTAKHCLRLRANDDTVCPKRFTCSICEKVLTSKYRLGLHEQHCETRQRLATVVEEPQDDSDDERVKRYFRTRYHFHTAMDAQRIVDQLVSDGFLTILDTTIRRPPALIDEDTAAEEPVVEEPAEKAPVMEAPVVEAPIVEALINVTQVIVTEAPLPGVPRTIGGISLGKLDRHRKKYWATKRQCEAKKVAFDEAIGVPKALLNQFATNPVLEKEYYDWIKTEVTADDSDD